MHKKSCFVLIVIVLIRSKNIGVFNTFFIQHHLPSLSYFSSFGFPGFCLHFLLNHVTLHAIHLFLSLPLLVPFHTYSFIIVLPNCSLPYSFAIRSARHNSVLAPSLLFTTAASWGFTATDHSAWWNLSCSAQCDVSAFLFVCYALKLLHIMYLE